jgi:cytochrome c oxidase subunit II
MPRLIRRVLVGFVVLALLAPALGCAPESLFPPTPQSTVYPETDATELILDVYRPVTWIMVVIFVVVQLLLIYAALRFRQRPGEDGHPRQVHGNSALEIGWTLVPVVIVIAIIFPTLRSLWALAEPPNPSDPLVVKVIGKQWWWEFVYPEEMGVTTANELRLPTDRLVVLELTSDNVIHSFWVPRLSGKRDLVPGRSQNIWFTTPSTAGEYWGQCAELCGASHALMRFRVFVDEREDFATWAEREAGPVVVATSMEDEGPAAMLAGGCNACHKIEFPGSFFQSRLGPVLTHVGSRSTIAAGILENTPENMARWIRHPEEIKPGSLMPNPDWLSDEQIDSIVAYLQRLE